MLQLILQRRTFTSKSTCGDLSIGDRHECYTLELPDKDGLPGSCIPRGIYPVTIDWSPRFARPLPHINDIPNRSNILIHWGNIPGNTEGCILVGRTSLPDFVGESRFAFEALFPKIGEAGGCTIEVRGGAKVPPIA